MSVLSGLILIKLTRDYSHVCFVDKKFRTRPLLLKVWSLELQQITRELVRNVNSSAPSQTLLKPNPCGVVFRNLCFNKPFGDADAN